MKLIILISFDNSQKLGQHADFELVRENGVRRLAGLIPHSLEELQKVQAKAIHGSPCCCLPSVLDIMRFAFQTPTPRLEDDFSMQPRAGFDKLWRCKCTQCSCMCFLHEQVRAGRLSNSIAR